MLVMLGCTDPVTPATPQPSPSETADTAPSTSEPIPTAPSPTPIAAKSYTPPNGWSVLARLDPEEQLHVFPLDNGDALLEVVSLKGKFSSKLAKLSGGVASWDSGLGNGLSTSALAGTVLVAGHWPDNVWIASGSPCVVRQWSGGRWFARDTPTPLQRCSNLTTWLPNSAIAAGEGKSGLTLAAYGTVPKVFPVASKAPKKLGQSTCTAGPLAAVYYQLRGFETGELLAVGGSQSCQGASVLERWSPGSSRSVVSSALLDPNSPMFTAIRSKDEVYLEGVGLNDVTKEMEQSAVSHRFDAKGKLTSMTKKLEGLNRSEAWLMGAAEAAGFSKAKGGEGFDYDSYAFDLSGDGIYVFGELLQEEKAIETLVLVNRPVKEPLSTISPAP